MFYTYTHMLSTYADDPDESAMLTAAMTERFKLYRFASPIPMNKRQADFPICGACFARFVMHSGNAWDLEQSGAPDAMG